jgi:hypothetical protein
MNRVNQQYVILTFKYIDKGLVSLVMYTEYRVLVGGGGGDTRNIRFRRRRQGMKIQIMAGKHLKV